MVTPNFLQQGDKIGIVSTARKVSLKELQPAIDCFENWGLDVVLGDYLFREHHQFAGTDEERAADFQSMMDDDEIKAIICARGGYGTVRIIDRLNFSHFIEHPKWICGFSDVTVLHSHIHQNFGIETIHGLMGFNLGKLAVDSTAIQTLKQALFGENIDYGLSRHELNRAGEAKGIVVGGNLSILYSLLGSPSDVDTTNKILFLEDLDEYLYHIDRMMMNLKRNGKLSNLRALVVGGMSDMNDNAVAFGKTAEEIIAEIVSEYDYPVCFNFSAGHIDDNRAIYLGREIKVSVGSEKTVLTY